MEMVNKAIYYLFYYVANFLTTGLLMWLATLVVDCTFSWPMVIIYWLIVQVTKNLLKKFQKVLDK